MVRGGVLTGSRLSVGEMVPLLARWCGLPPGQSVAMATWNPATLLGLAGRRGNLAPGAHADLCVLDPETLEVRAAMAGGRWASKPEMLAES